jgi:hypothetical protein
MPYATCTQHIIVHLELASLDTLNVIGESVQAVSKPVDVLRTLPSVSRAVRCKPTGRSKVIIFRSLAFLLAIFMKRSPACVC